MYFVPGDTYKIGLFFHSSGIYVTLVWEVTNAGIPCENKTHPISQQTTECRKMIEVVTCSGKIDQSLEKSLENYTLFAS